MDKARGFLPLGIPGHYLLVFFVLTVMVLAVAFGFAAFAFMTIDLLPPSAR